jgi:hypothetical protein
MFLEGGQTNLKEIKRPGNIAKCCSPVLPKNVIVKIPPDSGLPN